jgi:hypothetical protein
MYLIWERMKIVRFSLLPSLSSFSSLSSLASLAFLSSLSSYFSSPSLNSSRL